MSRRVLFLAWILGSVLFLSTQHVYGDVSDKAFVMTTQEPVLAGETVLTPGTYLWRLLDSPSEPHVVQIVDQKTGRVEASIVAMPKYRETVSSKNVIEFWETPAGVPRAVRAWFYPGDNYGQEFAFPKKAVETLSKLHPYQAAMGPRTEAETPAPPKVTVKHVAVRHTPAAILQPAAAGNDGSWAVASSTKAAATPKRQPTAVKRPGFWDSIRNLPLTATIAPLIALIGLSCLALFGFSFLKRPEGESR